MKIDGSVIPGSNIVKLVRDVVRPKRGKRDDPPVGRAQFIGALKRVKVPPDAVGNKSFWRDDDKEIVNSSELAISPHASKILSSTFRESPEEAKTKRDTTNSPKRKGVPW